MIKIKGRDIFMTALDAWAKSRGITLNENQRGLCFDALTELPALNNGQFDNWWLHNYYRYSSMTEIDRKRTRDAIKVFLSPVVLMKEVAEK